VKSFIICIHRLLLFIIVRAIKSRRLRWWICSTHGDIYVNAYKIQFEDLKGKGHL